MSTVDEEANNILETIRNLRTNKNYLLEELKTATLIDDEQTLLIISNYFFTQYAPKEKLNIVEIGLVGVMMKQQGFVDCGINEISKQLRVSLSAAYNNIRSLKERGVIESEKYKNKVIIFLRPSFINKVVSRMVRK